MDTIEERILKALRNLDEHKLRMTTAALGLSVTIIGIDSALLFELRKVCLYYAWIKPVVFTILGALLWGRSYSRSSI